MRLRIIIDTQDADDSPDMPFTLNLYRDDDDGTQSAYGHDIGSETCLIGYDIPAMLRELADKWQGGAVVHDDGGVAPRTGAEWLQELRRENEED